MDAHRTPEEWYRISEFDREPAALTVERYTDDSVWVDGRRRARLTSYECHFPTKAEAWDWAIAKAVGRRDNAQTELDRQQARLDRLKEARADAGE